MRNGTLNRKDIRNGTLNRKDIRNGSLKMASLHFLVCTEYCEDVLYLEAHSCPLELCTVLKKLKCTNDVISSCELHVDAIKLNQS